MIRVHVFIYGRVQGVFFRAGIREKTHELNIKGSVRNVDDKVEAIFEGEEDSINKMLNFCKSGPIGAKVKKIEVKEEVYKNEFGDFTIEY